MLFDELSGARTAWTWFFSLRGVFNDNSIQQNHLDKHVLTKAFYPLEDWRAGGEFFPHRSHRVFFKRSHRDMPLPDDRPVLLLIHGFPTASWDWSPLWAQLATRFNLIAPDLLGFGFSAKPTDYQYSILDQADLCEELLSRFGIQHYHIMAHDYGDTVAQELLARHHDGSARVELQSICLLNGGLFPETHRPRLVQRLLLSPLGPFVAKRFSKARFAVNMTNIFGRDTPPSKADIDVMWDLMNENDGTKIFPQLIEYMRERRRYRTRWVGALNHAIGDVLHRPIPIRLIAGASDPISGRHMAVRYRELVAHADIMLLHGIGHYPQIEAPQLVLRGYFDFYETQVAP